MTLYRWEPRRDIFALQNHVNSLFQDFSGKNAESESFATAGFVPPVDILEDEHKVVLKLEIPGVRLEDLDVHLENSTLSVKGERNFKSEGKEENFHRIERKYGAFYRAFTVPTTINAESIKANYEAGILSIELAKRAETKPKQIKVNVTAAHELNNQPQQEAVKTA